MALQKLNLARKKAEKEKAAKIRYLKKKEKEGKAKSSAKEPQKKQSNSKTSSRIAKTTRKDKRVHSSCETICPVCLGSFEDENELELGTMWVECDHCHKWMHHDCDEFAIFVQKKLNECNNI